MNQFVDEKALAPQVDLREIIAVSLTAGMEMQVPARGHGDLTRLKRKPFFPPDHNSAVIDCVTENGSRKLYLA